MSFYSIAPFIQEFYSQYYSIETYPVTESVAIRKVAEPWGIFGNFARTPIIIDGVMFKTSELLFQLMKFKDKEPARHCKRCCGTSQLHSSRRSFRHN